MAPNTALSSNWKKLQAQLKEKGKEEKATSTTATSQPTTTAATKISSTNPNKRKQSILTSSAIVASSSSSTAQAKPRISKRRKLDPSISPSSSASVIALKAATAAAGAEPATNGRHNQDQTQPDIYRGPRGQKLTEKNLNRVATAGSGLSRSSLAVSTEKEKKTRRKDMGSYLSMTGAGGLGGIEDVVDEAGGEDQGSGGDAVNLKRQRQKQKEKQRMQGTSTRDDAERPAAVVKREARVNEGLSPNAQTEKGKYLALDCEMVGVGPNPAHTSALARVSIVTYTGTQLYDSYVLPQERVTDWRTSVSGITPSCMTHARPFSEVQATVANLLSGGTILVGHAIRNDLAALMLSHPKRDIRDTSRHAPYRKFVGGGAPSLKVLAAGFLGVEIQRGEHSSVEDARATMMLFRRDKDAFEKEVGRRFGQRVLSAAAATAAPAGDGGEGTSSKKKKKKGKKK